LIATFPNRDALHAGRCHQGRTGLGGRH
jgi:hypothetical protein